MTSSVSTRTVREILTLAEPYLEKRGVFQSRRTMEEVVAYYLKKQRLELYMDLDLPLSTEEVEKLSQALLRLGRREPWQYVCGKVEFYGCDLIVTPDVLIPRQETEILVDMVLEKLPQNTTRTVWDLCCGSGCIGIALKKARPDLKVVLSDFSPNALEIARQNASANAVEVEIRHGDLFAPFFGEKADCIVCNPPYVAEGEEQELEPEVRDFEPHEALFGGQDGLDFYRRIAEEFLQYLEPKGQLWLELGKEQGEAVQQLFNGRGKCENDWAGHNRFFLLENQ